MSRHQRLYNTLCICLLFWLPLCFIQYNTLSAQEAHYAIPPENSYFTLSGFSEGLAVFRDRETRHGYIDAGKNQVIAPKFEKADAFHEGLAAYKKDRKWGLMNKKGEVVLKARYDQEPYDFTNGFSLVQIQRNG